MRRDRRSGRLRQQRASAGGVTLIGPAFTDDALAPLADALHRAAGSGMGIDETADHSGGKPRCTA